MTLEERVQRLEDLAAITQVIAAYGPAVDSGSSDLAAALFTPDGVYDVPPLRLEGTEALRAMVAGPHHQVLLDRGCAHLQGQPVITLQGDTAVAVNHSIVLLHDDQGFQVWRVAANRWTLSRTSDGWRVSLRTNRLLDGAEEARQLLRGNIDP